MASTHFPTLGQFVNVEPVSQDAYIDITTLAKNSGFHFSYTGMSQTAYYQAIDVPNCLAQSSPEGLTQRLLKLVWRAARKHPMQSQVTFTVCKPPTKDSVYVNQPLSLLASIEHNKQQEPILIITTTEEAR
ncbi:hypothetical protein [Vibrio sp. TBV020]|uniref:hypothetical protein n=1 Tax=Vibrio sp. TBV020 TaxID=3137398 RepID=UPI0038CD4D33